MPETKPANLNPLRQSEPAKASFMQAWWLQYYKLVTAGTCLLLGLGAYFLLLGPKIDKVRNIANIILAEEETKAMALKTRIEYLVNLESARGQIAAADVERITDMLPSEPGVPELFASLESIGADSFVKLESIQFSKLTSSAERGNNNQGQAKAWPGGAEAIEIQLTVANTPYSNVKTLVGNIEKSLRLMDVTALLYSPVAKSYSLTVRSYYLP